ncbi:hypothetical protein NM688_g4231 [Phlebia brevispora]|uniref:Uncharacterized protein n=1 Tax=Phlebia brevispora TaxID=194682 RepID=A0ACC1T3A6_9APHY|nr:hypothetical protein NM688_g4231 [Phlebia brevispora]
MTSTTLPAVLAAYPESSAFDWKPLIYNLAPEDQTDDLDDTPEFLTAVRAQAKRDGMNPLWRWYGVNPVTLFDETLEDADLPMTAYNTPPPLSQVDLSGVVAVVEQLNPKGTMPMFKVRIGDDVRVMKVFMDADRDEVDHPDRDMPWVAMARFRREKEAYEHLLHYGACQKGVVPMCYGWAELPFPLVDELSERFGDEDGEDRVSQDIAYLKYFMRQPKAIILEYIEDTVPLSLSNVSTAIAEKTLRALCAVHACYVQQNDIARRNILICKDERVVLVDFDFARCVSKRKPDRVRRQDLLSELATAWSLFYADLVCALLDPMEEVWLMGNF